MLGWIDQLLTEGLRCNNRGIRYVILERSEGSFLFAPVSVGHATCTTPAVRTGAGVRDPDHPAPVVFRGARLFGRQVSFFHRKDAKKRLDIKALDRAGLQTERAVLTAGLQNYPRTGAGVH